ncbi:putative gram domain-containing protein [Golovinomyces cichoracearum]|uniref:Putative gram domain-containing protein n=1 Tax=Golovinomyces cichoracearum TaxID=62708 RepID=A0A420JB00_9PEZI|nr:putative gram domain-containing protein [Golovinomyces cichoracearum]
MSFSPEISFSNFRKKSSFFNVASRPRGSCGNRPDEESTRRSLVDPLDTTDHFKEETRRLYQNVLQQMRGESQITARKEYRGESRGDIQSIEQTVQGRNVSDSSNLASMTNAFENPFLEGVNNESSTQYPITSFDVKGRLVAAQDYHTRSRAATLPTKKHTDAAESMQSQSKILPQSSDVDSKRRSTSPVGKLKVALKSRRSTSHLDWKTNSKDFGLFREKPSENSRGSVASRIGSIFHDKREVPPVRPLPLIDRPKQQHSIHAYTSPRTPPSEKVTRLISDIPPTPTKNSAQNLSQIPTLNSSGPILPESNVVNPVSETMISSGRVRSGSTTLVPSKLSNITNVPLTPTPENCSTSLGQEGFFSTVISAAQNAANTLSSSIGSNSASSGVKDRICPTDSEKFHIAEDKKITEKSDPAVKTLGTGDLSLGHLGISENTNNDKAPSNNKGLDNSKGKFEVTHDESNAALSRSFTAGLSLTSDPIGSYMAFDEVPHLGPPRTGYEGMAKEDQTKSNASMFEGNTGTYRSNSNKSGRESRRKRSSSVSNPCIVAGASAVAVNASTTQPPKITPKITGFAVASKKRNKDFHQLFRSVPEDDYLIEDYSCALQREILAHGRLYVSEGHLCFSSNIFGWVTTLVMSFDEIVSVEKRSTALVFKNGLMITTLHAKNVFASFTSRDSTYDLIVGIWKLGHPYLRNSLNGVHINHTGCEKIEKDDGYNNQSSQSDSDPDLDEEEENDLYEDDDEDEYEKSSNNIGFTNAEECFTGSEFSQKIPSKRGSNAIALNSASLEKCKEDDGSSIPAAPDFPGPLLHPPTESSDPDSHYSKIIIDELIPAPLGKVWSLIFGAGSQSWLYNFLTVDQKCFDYSLEESAKKPLGLDNKVRNYTYIKPLNGPIGPKQTKCICIETLEFLDFEKYIVVSVSTQTPDVPSGNVFCIKTRYCLSWGPNNGTRLQMSYVIEWTGRSWLKGPIEKGAADGQIQYARDIVGALKSSLSVNRGSTSTPIKGKKGRRKDKEGKSFGRTANGALKSKSNFNDWGILKSSFSFLEPLIDILRPLFSGNILYGILVGFLIASCFRFGLIGNRGSQSDLSCHRSPETIAAYEEIWRKEESELWKWLEDRVGMEALRDMGSMPLEGKEIDRRLKDETYMQEFEIENAIKVTEKKLEALKKSVEAARESRIRAGTCDVTETESTQERKCNNEMGHDRVTEHVEI